MQWNWVIERKKEEQDEEEEESKKLNSKAWEYRRTQHDVAALSYIAPLYCTKAIGWIYSELYHANNVQ